ncbi:MAG: hypothetical protein ABI777_07165 [Betaproteobacteria bacterium]
MAADIVATPNPVDISTWSVSQLAPTTVSWTTGDPAVEGTVWITDDAGTRKFVDHTGAPAVGATGSAPARIGPGQQVLFALKRTDNPALNLDTVLVVGREKLGLPSGIIDDIRKRMPLLQGITNVRVFPGIESVRVMFRTRQPTTPVIDIKDSVTQALAGAAFPFLQGAATAHDYSFPLPQNTDFTFHIFAPPGQGSVTPKAAEASGMFRTGFRNAEVFFDRIFMHTDGDPGALGDGDFRIDMGVGDIDNGGMLGAKQTAASISGGENRWINESVALPACPVGLWVQVRADEDDSFHTPYGGPPEVFFAAEGSTWAHHETSSREWETATVTKWFDLSGAGPVAQETSFTLETGPRHIDFSLVCRIRMEAREGVVVQPLFTKSSKPKAPLKTMATMVAGARVALAGRRPHVVQLAYDGALYHAFADAPKVGDASTGTTHWQQLPSMFKPPLTLVAHADELHVLAINDAGVVQHHVMVPGDASPDAGPGKTRALGGEALSAVVAAAARDQIELFAVATNGAIYHRTLAPDTAKAWTRVGEGMAGSLNAFTTPDGEVGLVARGRNGDAMYAPWSGNASGTAAAGWRSLGKTPSGSLSVECIDDVIVLAVLGDDEIVHAAPWRNHPALPSKLEWRAVASMNALIDASYSLVDAPSMRS